MKIRNKNETFFEIFKKSDVNLEMASYNTFYDDLLLNNRYMV